MKSFDIEREKIIEIFGGRPGFTDEVIDAITATYVYFDDKYKELIPIEEIPDAKTFKNVTLPKSSYSIAEIYLNRIYNNVTEVVSDHGPAGPTASQFDYHELKIYVPPNDHYSWDNRLNDHVDIKNASKEERALRRRQIRAKVITHELIHAASFNGEFIGFIGTSNKNLSKLKQKYGNDKATEWTASSSNMLEELITEELALDIVGMTRKFSTFINDVSAGKNNDYIYHSRNPESSNGTVNSIGAYLINAIPEIVRGKFINPIEFLIKFNKEPENFGRSPSMKKEFGLCFCLCELIEIIRDECKKKYTDKNEEIAYKMIEIQVSCLNIYLRNLNIETPQDYLAAVKAYTAFKANAVWFYDKKTGGIIVEELAEMLNKLQQTIKLSYAKFTEQQKRELKERHDFECSINLGDEPYAHIISNGLLEDSFNLLMF